jgi:sugar phosphate permease
MTEEPVQPDFITDRFSLWFQTVASTAIGAMLIGAICTIGYKTRFFRNSKVGWQNDVIVPSMLAGILAGGVSHGRVQHQNEIIARDERISHLERELANKNEGQRTVLAKH